MLDELLYTLVYTFSYWLTFFVVGKFISLSQRNRHFVNLTLKIVFFIPAIGIAVEGYMTLQYEGGPSDFGRNFIIAFPLLVSVAHNLNPGPGKNIFRKQQHHHPISKFQPANPEKKLLLRAISFSFFYWLAIAINDFASSSQSHDPQGGIGKALMALVIVFVFFLIAMGLTVFNYSEYKKLKPAISNYIAFAPAAISIGHILYLVSFG
jgi:hypothetical protein